MASEANPLSKLNERELHVLRLLSAGHTAKSIAASTGLSVSAVNERLRDARRKTGIGSSREIARLITSPKNWDEKIELPYRVGEEHEAQDVRLPIGKPKGRKGKIMVLSLAALAVFFALWPYGVIAECLSERTLRAGD